MKGISLEHVEIILRYIVWQRHRELKEGKLEHEKRESEIRRQSELPTDLTGKSRRVIPVDPIISPFDSGEEKTPEGDIHMSCNSKTACFPVNYAPHSLQDGQNAVSGAVRLQMDIVC